MIDAKELIETAEAEVEKELVEAITRKVKAKLREIKMAEKIVQNLRFELQAIVQDASA